MGKREDWESAYESGDYKHWEFNYPSPELAALVATAILKPHGHVLDVGCGGGLDAIYLARCGFQVVGVDISAAAVKIARRRARQAHVHVDWRRADALALPLDDSSIDFVNDRGVFHILEDRDRPGYASELFRVLKPGGKILLRGSSDRKRFNPVTARAIDKHFPPPEFSRGPVLPIPLLSIVGAMEARIVVLTKIEKVAPKLKTASKRSRAIRP